MERAGGSRGFSLLELVVIMAVLLRFMAMGFSMIRLASQKGKIAVAKAYISQYASLVDSIRNDVGYYPPSVHETLESLTYKDSPFPERRGWQGPYLKSTPVDPWKTPYFYCVTKGVVLGPIRCQRGPRGGVPYEETFTFRTPATGQGGVVIYNFDVGAGRVVLNGVEIFGPLDFNPNIEHLEETVTLTGGTNTLYVWIPSNVRPHNYFLVSITSPFSRATTYILGSRGADGQPGGAEFEEDLVWIEGQATGSFK